MIKAVLSTCCTCGLEKPKSAFNRSKECAECRWARVEGTEYLPQARLRKCTCCGSLKKRTDFSTGRQNADGRTTHCLDCGVWLSLLRKAFGPTRDWERNRVQQRVRDFDYTAMRRHASSTPLAGVIQTMWR